MLKSLFIVILALGLSAGGALAGRLDAAAVNDAQFHAIKGKGIDPAILKAQILLDRTRFSPGVVDGRPADNFAKALTAFQAANGLTADGNLTQETWDKLTATAAGPALKDYELTRADVKGPFTKRIPARMEAMARLRRLGYRNTSERLSERFHMSEELLRLLNPRARLTRAGTTLVVADVGRGEAPKDVASVEVDKDARTVRALAADGRQIAVYPASIGSEEKPAPSGEAEIRRAVRNPTYHYNPAYAFKGVKTKRPFTIAAGPNSPVGTVWIDLSLEGYGIHGTPEPRKIGTTYSHGCIRLTNWDAEDLAAMVKPGTKVMFKDEAGVASQ